MITSRIYRDGVLEKEVPFDPDHVDLCRAAEEHRIWIDVVDPSDEELTTLQRSLRLHELSIEDSRTWGQRSKLEFYEDYVFLVAHGVEMGRQEEVIDSELHMFAGERFYVLTIRREPLYEFRRAIERIGRSPNHVREGIGFHMYVLLDEIVDGYLDAVEALEDLGDDVEERIFSDEGDTALQERIFHLKHRVARFRRAAAPLREVIDRLMEHEDVASPALLPYYRDVLDHLIRSLELIDNIRELLTSGLEAILAQASNRLNVVMKQLSAWAAIILVPTLIAGIYGMNFRHMPELDWRFGYPLALGMMGVSALLLFRAFRRRDWF